MATGGPDYGALTGQPTKKLPAQIGLPGAIIPAGAPVPGGGPGDAYQAIAATPIPGLTSGAPQLEPVDSFGRAGVLIDENKAALLAAMARGGTAGAQAFQQARQQVSTQQDDALALARAGTISAPGLDAQVANQVRQPAQQRLQAMTQAEANLTADLDRSRAASERYLGDAKAILPFQAEQARQQQDAYSRGWDRWLMMEQEKQAAQAAAAASRSGGGGGGGGGSGAASKPLAVGATTDLLTSLIGEIRSSEGQQYLDAADRLMAGPASDSQYLTDQMNLEAMLDPYAGSEVLTPYTQQAQDERQAEADRQYEIDLANQFAAMDPYGDGRPTQSLDSSRLQGIANVRANETGATGSRLDAIRAQNLRGLVSGAAPEVIPEPVAPAGPPPEYYLNRSAELGRRQAEIGETLAGLAGPGYAAYGRLGGAARETLNSPNSVFAPDAALLASALGYNIGPYADPILAQGMFPALSPFEEEKRSNDILAEQQQAINQARGLGAFEAQSQFFGSSDPTEVGYRMTLADLAAPGASAATAASKAEAQQAEAGAKAEQEAFIQAVVDGWAGDVEAGLIDGTGNELYQALVLNGVPPYEAIKISSTVAGQATGTLIEE